VTEIEAPELVAMTKAIEQRGARDIAKRALENDRSGLPLCDRSRLRSTEPSQRDSSEGHSQIHSKGKLRPSGRQGASGPPTSHRGLPGNPYNPSSNQAHGVDVRADQ